MFNFSVKEAKYINNYKVWLKFHDNKQGEVDLSGYLSGEIFQPLKSISYFKKLTLQRSTISWENGADFAPEFLYDLVNKQNN
jgi:hypothetical protein